MGKFFTWLQHSDQIIHFIEDKSGKMLLRNLLINVSEKYTLYNYM